MIEIFLSTLSLRRATHLFASSGVDFAISIHALLAESDLHNRVALIPHQQFLSTLSLRRATFRGDHGHINGDISIHALLAESDHDSYVVMEATKVISIHALLAESDFTAFDLITLTP